MRRGLSLYLDLLRFLLALTVMLGHATEPGYIGRLSEVWTFPHYGLTAVMGFFVLSGFVIAHVTQGSESRPTDYFAARAARMYSIVIPALLLTALLGVAGAFINPETYLHGPIHVGAHQPRRYFLTALFAQDFWIWRREMTPGINHPFWSLSYEVTYYVLFGLTLVRRPRVAVLGGLALLCLAGPKIAALLPIWVLGVLAYRGTRRFTLPAPLCAVLMIGTLCGLYVTGTYRGADDPVNRYTLDYLEGFLFAVNIIAAAGLAPWLERALGWCPRFIRWLGMLTFALYLCHRPLMYFLSAVPMGAPGEWRQSAWLFGMTLAVVIGIAHLGEWFRGGLRRSLTRLLPQIPLHRAPLAATPGCLPGSSSGTTAPR
ncbi:MAG TPA: acyltransferase [Steroidobacteraceae bacterium]|nr:acyltransferase [Steroidobacteraceae bacterium]